MQRDAKDAGGIDVMTTTARRVAMVTGAARGIGRATAYLLARRGYQLALVDRDEAGIARVAEELRRTGAQTEAWVVDVASPPDVERVVQIASQSFGRIDLLVHAAGIMSTASVEDCPPGEWEHVLAVNLTGTFAACHSVVPIMKAQGGGAIVVLSSQAARSGSTIAGVAYVATKAGILGMVRHMAYHLASAGIRVNAVAPGMVDTDMPRAHFSMETIEQALSAVPVHRMASPEEVAEAIAFLGSDAASYISGETLYISGGRSGD